MHSRLVFSPDHLNNSRASMHYRLTFLAQVEPSPAAAAPPALVMSAMVTRFAYGLARGNNLAQKTWCLIEESQETMEEEARPRESVLVITVDGTRPTLIPANIAEVIRVDFLEMPSNGM